MTSQQEQGAEERFARAWKHWLERPLQKQPSEAATRISDLLQLQPQAHHPRWIPLAAAAALTCALGVSTFWVFRQVTNPRHPAEIREAPPLGKGEVLIWLDEKTPLYMTFQPPDVPDASGGKR